MLCYIWLLYECMCKNVVLHVYEYCSMYYGGMVTQVYLCHGGGLNVVVKMAIVHICTCKCIACGLVKVPCHYLK